MANNYSGMFPNQNDWRDQQRPRDAYTARPMPAYQQRPDPVNPASKVMPNRYRRPAGGGMNPSMPLSGGTRRTGLTPSNRTTSAPQSLAQSQQFQGQRPPGSLAAMEAALSQRPDFQALGQESGYSPRGFGEFIGEVGRLGGLGATRGAQGIADYWQSITTPKDNYQRPVGPRGMSEQNLSGVYGSGRQGQGLPIPQTQQPGLAQAVSPNEAPQNRTFSTATGRDANPPSLGQRSLANQRLGGAEITQGPADMQRQAFQGGPSLAQGEQRLMGRARTRYLGQGGTAEFQGMRQGGGGFGGAATNAQAQATLDDYRSRGLNMYGNDMNAINQLNQTADRMQQSRLANVAGNPEFRNADRDQARQTLATLQQGTQIQQQGQQAQQQTQAAAQQQAIDNRINFERLGLDQAEFNRQVEQDGKLDRVEWGAKIAETYDPFNAPKDAEGNPVDRETYVQQTLNDILAGTGVVAGPDGTIYSAAEIQSLADARFGGDVDAARADMRAQGFLGV